jgi:hypothetical protein
VVTALAVVALAGHLLLVAAVLRRLAGRVPLRETLTGHGLLPARLRHPAVPAALEAGQLVVGLAGVAAFLGGRSAGAYWAVSCVLAATLYAVFGGYLTLLLRMRGRVPCGCFGRRDRVGPPTIVRAVGFAVAAGLAAPTAVAAPLAETTATRVLTLVPAALIAAFAVYTVAFIDAIAASRTLAKR